MINILIPMAAKSIFFKSEEYIYPKPLIEINGKSMIEWVIEDFKKIKGKKNFIFIVRSSDCDQFHIDNVLKLLTDDQCQIIRMDQDTKGAACSCLMAIDHINTEIPLIIVNSDQIIKEDLNHILDSFAERHLDAGVICFDSVHPRWSFARLDDNDKIVEIAEKRPISKHAIAGFYYFAQGTFFIKAAMTSIEKDANVSGLYYIAPVLNELVLEGKNLEIFKIKNENYHTFYSPQMIEEFEKHSRSSLGGIEKIMKMSGKK